MTYNASQGLGKGNKFSKLIN